MPVSERNPELLDLLQGEFQRKYEPNFASGNAISHGRMLPGLRGFWPMSTISNTGTVLDASDLGKTLTRNGSIVHGYTNLIPWAYYDGVGDFHSRADEADLDILGTEAYVQAPFNGLTIGGWFSVDVLAGAIQGLIGKWNQNAVNQRSYTLWVTAGNVVQFGVSSTGANTFFATSTAVMVARQWFFAAGRFFPNTEVAVWHNGTKNTNVAAMPAAIFNSTAQLNVGAHSNGGLGLLTGYVSLCFLSCQALSDTFMFNYYQQTRALFGI
jgi:hypothetical protein